MGLGVTAAVALQHGSRNEIFGRVAVLVAYLAAATLLGDAAPSILALLILPAIGITDMVVDAATK
jgi:hypothetical protein